MAIDTKSVSQLIAEFRKLQAKDAITPESLGYILQRLTNLLATAGALYHTAAPLIYLMYDYLYISEIISKFAPVNDNMITPLI